MTEIKLPPLPMWVVGKLPYGELYTISQMTAYGIASQADLVARVQELEAAAKLALDALRLSIPAPREGDDDYCIKGMQEHFSAIESLRKLGIK